MIHIDETRVTKGRDRILRYSSTKWTTKGFLLQI